ncbi:uncharacterized protein LOC124306690 [Neodiprion virginianus]|uniref:uncharacterized protein LOC124306690 n=1 Tax=Neodiprion virginianus TaxID=2961670 RepID=UPI001EE6FA78|nr:uncharacterized protein LOC124306690 [Neodiprion virginianus]
MMCVLRWRSPRPIAAKRGQSRTKKSQEVKGSTTGGASLTTIESSGREAAESALTESACSGFLGALPDQNFAKTLVKSQHRKLAFHEPRPCDICNRVYRDAATLRQHTFTMHSAGTHVCGCGAYFYTKYDMLIHRKQAHF